MGMFAISFGIETLRDGMPALTISALIIGFFLMSCVISFIAVLSGIGGGVLFTPFLLPFTVIDSLIVRATGLIVATFSGLIFAGPFLHSGLGNLRMSIILSIFYGLGAFLGAQGTIYVYAFVGARGFCLSMVDWTGLWGTCRGAPVN
jgi:uncharacterized protein